MPREGGGAATAPALVASIGEGPGCKQGRQVAAGLGLVPRPDARGGKPRRGHSRKRGNGSRRTRLLHGARRVRPRTSNRTEAKRRGAEPLKHRRGNNSAAVALSAKNARIIWALRAGPRGPAGRLTPVRLRANTGHPPAIAGRSAMLAPRSARRWQRLITPPASRGRCAHEGPAHRRRAAGRIDWCSLDLHGIRKKPLGKLGESIYGSSAGQGIPKPPKHEEATRTSEAARSSPLL
jgi:hypothetical protein